VVLVPTVKNLIFDLGGVILDLSVPHTIQAFSDLSGLPTEEVVKIFFSSPEFNDYEKGLLSDTGFRDFVRYAYKIRASDSQIDDSWNAMLRGFSKKKLELLKKLKQQYRVFLLSNTNNIHLQHINQVVLKNVTGENDLDTYFHRAYYSHKLLMRKPEPQIFKKVLFENDLRAEETLFMDDNAANIDAAQQLNIKTIYINTPDHILNVFKQ
jgi:glucose-1-phosphatase